MKTFEDWTKINESVKKDLKNYHLHDIVKLRINILSLINELKNFSLPLNVMNNYGWSEIKEKNNVFGIFIDRLIGSLGETDDLNEDRFFYLIALAKQRGMRIDFNKMNEGVENILKKITLNE